VAELRSRGRGFESRPAGLCVCVCVCVYVCSSTQNVRFESITVENCNFFAVKMLTFIQRKRDFHLQMQHRLHLLYNMGVENAEVEFAALNGYEKPLQNL